MKQRIILHNCIRCVEHNAIIMTDSNGKINIHSKFYNVFDRPEEDVDDWYMRIRLCDINCCPYCGEKLS